MLWVWLERKKGRKEKKEQEGKKGKKKEKEKRKIYRNNYNPLNKTRNDKYLCKRLAIVALSVTAKDQKQPRCPSVKTGHTNCVAPH